jgi:hypothetical protein
MNQIGLYFKTVTDSVYPPENLIECTVVKTILFCRCIVLKLFPSMVTILKILFFANRLNLRAVEAQLTKNEEADVGTQDAAHADGMGHCSLVHVLGSVELT